MGCKKSESTQRQNWLSYICVTNSKKHLTHQKMISSSLFRRIGMNVFSIPQDDLGCCGNIQSPRDQGEPVFLGSKGQQSSFGRRWVITDTGEGGKLVQHEGESSTFSDSGCSTSCWREREQGFGNRREMAAGENLIFTVEGPGLMGCRRESSPSWAKEAK